MPLEIGGRPVGPGQPVLTIAELGLNHGGDRHEALRLVDLAAEAGATAVKLQTLDASRLVIEGAPPPAHLEPTSLRERLGRLELDEAAHRAVFARARSRGLAVLSTPLYLEAVDLLNRLGCDGLKIASGDLTNHPLIVRAAATGRPLLLSTGMSTLPEIGAALDVARRAGAERIVLLHCVSSYPVPADQQNLRAIETLRTVFRVPVGLSDHARDPLAPLVAVSLGATVYERHFVSGDGSGAVDAEVSSTPEDLRERIQRMAAVQAALGSGDKTPMPCEQPNLPVSRRGLYAARDLAPGDVVTLDAVVALRPVTGVEPERLRELIGHVARRPIAAGEAFGPEDLIASPVALKEARGAA